MRKLLLLFVLAAGVLPACNAQTMTVNGSHVQDAAGNPCANCRITFAPVDLSGRPISFRIGGGGQVQSNPVSATVTNGAFSIVLPDVSQTNPINVCFKTTVVDRSTGVTVLGPAGYTCVQMSSTIGGWCGSTTCNLDNYVPNTPGLPLQVHLVLTTNGSGGPATYDGTTLNIPQYTGGSGSMTWPTLAGIPNYNGSQGWGTSYSASNLIPANFIPTLNQSTTGNAATATTATTATSAATATTATTATNVAGGAVGSIHYQSAANTTAMLAGNTAATDQAVISHGTGSAAQAPTLSNAPALSAANMTSFPTLNQSTTGNAATATSATSATTATTATTASNLSGTPALPNGTTATTQTTADSTAKLATDAFVQANIAAIAFPVTSFNSRTGAVVPASGDYSVGQVTGAAPLASPTFTGTPAAPTATPGTNTTQIASTAFVQTAVAAAGGMTWPALAGIANYAGSNTWGTSYSATNLIPANFISTLNQSTTGNAATSTTATNLAGGAAGSVAYQTAAGATSMLSGNTAATDQVYVSHGTGSAAQAPTLTNAPALSAANMTSFPTLNQSTTGNAATATSASSATTAGNLSGTPALPNGVTATTQTVADNTTKLATDAFVQTAVAAAGGMTWPAAAGIANYAGSNTWGTSYSATNPIPANFVSTLNQSTTGNAATATSATTSTNVAGGAVGSVPYQTAAGATSLLAGNSAATDQVYVSHGTGSAAQAPTLANAPALSAANMTSFPTLNQSTTGNAATATSATTATNVAGGVVGSVPYQTAAGATSLLAGNTAATDQVYVSHGTGSAAQAPTLTNAPALSAANMTSFPTLNQSTTGNAATATSATSATTAGNLSGTPALPNGVTATTQTAADSTTKLATDAFVATAVTNGTANMVTASSPGAGVAHFAGSTQAVTSSLIVAADITSATITGAKMANNTVTATQLAVQYAKGSCTEVWGGSGTSFALTSGDDAISNNTCYNDSGVTRTITAVKCRSSIASNTTTVNPTFGSAGTGTTILSGALTCGSSLAYSSTGTVTNASWTTGTGITPAMGGTLTGTSIAMIVEYTY